MSRTPCSNPSCGHVDDSEHPCGHICPQPRAAAPRPELAALFDAVAALPACSRAELRFHDGSVGADLRAWAAAHGDVVEEMPLYNREQGAWVYIWVALRGGRIAVHLDRVAEQPEAAERSAP